MKRTLAELRNLVLGSDIHPEDAGRYVADYISLSKKSAPDDEILLRGEDEILKSLPTSARSSGARQPTKTPKMSNE